MREGGRGKVPEEFSLLDNFMLTVQLQLLSIKMKKTVKTRLFNIFQKFTLLK